jgi:predicted nuclease with TOPRIM domain
MIKKVSLAMLIVLILLPAVGCEEETVANKNKIITIEQAQTRLAEDFNSTRLKYEALEARVKTFEKEASLLEEKVTNLQGRVKNVAGIPEKLLADVDANREYTKAVRNDLRAMRDKTVQMLDIQNKRIAEGRKAYVQVLEKEMTLLTGKLEQMKQAVAELEKEMPVSEEEVNSTMSLSTGDSNSTSEPTKITVSENK